MPSPFCVRSRVSLNSAVEAVSSVQRLSKDVEQTIAGAERHQQRDRGSQVVVDRRDADHPQERSRAARPGPRSSGCRPEDAEPGGCERSAQVRAVGVDELLTQVLEQAKKVARGGIRAAVWRTRSERPTKRSRAFRSAMTRARPTFLAEAGRRSGRDDERARVAGETDRGAAATVRACTQGRRSRQPRPKRRGWRGQAQIGSGQPHPVVRSTHAARPRCRTPRSRRALVSI